MKYFGKILSLQNQKAWTAYCGEYIIASIKKNIVIKNKVIIAFSGGNSPISIFRYIKDKKVITNDEWQQVYIYWIDERVVPFESDHNNAGNAIRTLDDINANFFPINTASNNPESIADNYEEILIKNIGFVDDFPIFDLVLLGMGEDGHIASLFPDTNAINESRKSVVANYVPKLNSFRITFSFPVLTKALDTLIMIRGQEKINIICELMQGNTGYPIEKMLQFENPKTWVLLNNL